MTIAAEHRLYAIGDIHGRLDLLEQMIDLINRDIESHAGKAVIATLGDYIDRGPDSYGVLDRLAKNPFNGRYVALKGNHEALLEAFLDNPAIGPDWWRLGGLDTVKSFKIAVEPKISLAGFKRVASELRGAMPQAQQEFLKSLKPSLMIGNFFLCHAGVRPDTSLNHQSEDDLLWIREAFLSSQSDFGKIIVHGHTPRREPEVLANRINIDTGAYASGRLTCVALDESGHRFITACSTTPAAGQ
jgi:serine/threonine protein phosphatase 1